MTKRFPVTINVETLRTFCEEKCVNSYSINQILRNYKKYTTGTLYTGTVTQAFNTPWLQIVHNKYGSMMFPYKTVSIDKNDLREYYKEGEGQ